MDTHFCAFHVLTPEEGASSSVWCLQSVVDFGNGDEESGPASRSG